MLSSLSANHLVNCSMVEPDDCPVIGEKPNDVDDDTVLLGGYVSNEVEQDENRSSKVATEKYFASYQYELSTEETSMKSYIVLLITLPVVIILLIFAHVMTKSLRNQCLHKTSEADYQLSQFDEHEKSNWQHYSDTLKLMTSSRNDVFESIDEKT